MAASDKNIVISPQRGSAALSPTITFTGDGNDPITLYTPDGAVGSLSFEGSAGQLFSITNNLTSGSIFSVNDVSGIPSLDIDASGLVQIAPLGGIVALGQTTVTAGNVLDVKGNVRIDGNLSITGTTLITNLNADLLDGQDGSYYRNASNINAGTIGDAYLPATISSDITGNAATATKLATARTISITGDGSGSASFDGSANVSISLTISDDSHNHIIGNIDGLQSALDAKAPLASPALTGTPTAPTATAGTNTTQIATTAFVGTAVANLVDSAPATLDTLNELAAALGDDPNFATTVTNSLATKLSTTTTFGGDVSGTYDAIVVADDSHTHDTRYYTETESDARFLGISAKAADSNLLDGIDSGSFLRSDANDTTTGNLTISKTSPKLILNDTNILTGSYPAIQFDTANNQGVLLEHNEFDSELPIPGYGLVLKQSPNNGEFPATGTLSFSVLGNIYAGGTTLGTVSRVLTTADEGSGNGLDADLLDGQQGSYYLDYNNFTNTPSIPGVGDGTLTVQGSNGLTGSGTFTANQSTNTTITVSHADTSSQGSVDNSDGTVIQDITLDGYGHVTGLASVNLDGRYYTETESDARFLGISAKAADSELLDGIDSGSFLRSDANDTATGVITLSGAGSDRLNIYNTTNAGEVGIRFSDNTNQGQNGYFRFRHSDTTSPGSAYAANFEFSTDQPNLAVIIDGSGDYFVGTSKVWHAGNDGSGTTLDADLLDGQQGSYYLNTSTSFGGDVSGTYNAIVVADDSHNHIISNVDGLQTALDGKLSTSGKAADSELLDGINSTSFLRSDANDSASGVITLTNTTTSPKLDITGQAGAANYNYILRAYNDTGSKAVHFVNGSTRSADGGTNTYTIRNDGGSLRLGISSYSTLIEGSGNLTFNSNTVWHAGNDGSGTNLDADLLDGIDSGSFLRSDTDDSASGVIDFLGGSLSIPAVRIKSGGNSWSEGLAVHPSADNGYALAFFRTSATLTTSTNTWAIGNLGVNGTNNFGLLRNGLTGSAGIRADSIFDVTQAGIFRFGFTPTVGSNTVWHAGNHGSGSGLDADTLDGIDSGSFLRSDVDDTFTRLSGTRVSAGYDSGEDNSIGCSNWFRSSGNTGLYFASYGGGWYMTDTTWIRTYNSKSIYQNAGTLRTDGTLQVGGAGATFNAPNGGTVTINGNTAWHAGNDGPGSNLDADTLDNIQASSFLRSDANDDATGSYRFNRSNPAIANTSYDQGNNHIELRTEDASNPILGFHRSGHTATALYHSGYGINSLRMRNADGNDGPIFSTFNDGSGTGLDADLLDGLNSATANTASTIVARDGSGNFSAGTITATLSGNASTSTTLQTTRTIWGQNFNGSANVSGALSGATTITASSDISLGGELNFTTANNKYIDFYTDNDAGSTYSAFLRLVNNGLNSFHVAMRMDRGGDVGLYNNNSLRFNTASDGVRIIQSTGYWTGLAPQNSYVSASLEGGAYIDFRNESGIPKGSIHHIFYTNGGSELRFHTTASGVARGTDNRTLGFYLQSDGITNFNQGIIVPQNNNTTGGGINFNAAGSAYIRGRNQDGASSTLSNLQLQSWYGIGFGPTISGQTVPLGENAFWINTRDGSWGSRGGGSINGNTIWHAGNDGPGTNLDADTLDTIQASSFLRSDTSATYYGGVLTITSNGQVGAYQGWGIRYADSAWRHVNTDSWGYALRNNGDSMTIKVSKEAGTADGLATFNDYTFGGGATASITIGGNAVWHAGNDGPNSTLDADTIDGIEGSSIVTTTTITNYSINPKFSSTIGFGNDTEILRFNDATNETRSGYWTNKDGFYIQGDSNSVNNVVLKTGNLDINQNAYIVGNLGVGGDINSSSDIKLKTNIKTLTNSLEKVLSLRGVEYDRVDMDNKHQIGVIAQEVEEIVPELVSESDGIKNVSYGNITALLIEAIKEQQKQIEALCQEISDLRSGLK